MARKGHMATLPLSNAMLLKFCDLVVTTIGSHRKLQNVDKGLWHISNISGAKVAIWPFLLFVAYAIGPFNYQFRMLGAIQKIRDTQGGGDDKMSHELFLVFKL